MLVARKLITQGGLIHMYKIMYYSIETYCTRLVKRQHTDHEYQALLHDCPLMRQKYVNFLFFPIYFIENKTFLKRFSGQIIGQILKKLILISSIVDSISTCCRTLVFDNSFVKFEYFKHNTEIVFKSSTIYFLQCMSRKILL